MAKQLEKQSPTTVIGGKKMNTMSLIIDPDLRIRLKNYASTKGIKIFKVFELALTRYLDEEEQQHD